MVLMPVRHVLEGRSPRQLHLSCYSRNTGSKTALKSCGSLDRTESSKTIARQVRCIRAVHCKRGQFPSHGMSALNAESRPAPCEA